MTGLSVYLNGLSINQSQKGMTMAIGQYVDLGSVPQGSRRPASGLYGSRPAARDFERDGHHFLVPTESSSRCPLPTDRNRSGFRGLLGSLAAVLRLASASQKPGKSP